MKRLVLLLALLLLTLLACKRLDWREFTSTEGRFSVLLPGEPKQELERIKTEGAGDIEQKSFMVDGKDFAFGVIYADYPRSLITPTTRDAILDGAVTGALDSVGGAAKTKRTINIDGHPGREFSTPTKDGFEYTARIYLVDNRLYQVVVTVKPDRSSSENELKFMDSFKLLK